MVRSAAQRSSLIPAASAYWRDCVGHSGMLRGSAEFLSACWEFVRASTPSRLRSRFGDADYDWDYRVNTTSGAVGWRDRLLGVFNSPYQPTEATLFHEMIDALAQQTNIDFSEFTFIDLGSGKGRALLMASDYPFRRILGVELLPALHQTCQPEYRGVSQRLSEMLLAGSSLRRCDAISSSRRPVSALSIQPVSGIRLAPGCGKPRKRSSAKAENRVRALPQPATRDCTQRKRSIQKDRCYASIFDFSYSGLMSLRRRSPHRRRSGCSSSCIARSDSQDRR